jgi:hypothetical protein
MNWFKKDVDSVVELVVDRSEGLLVAVGLCEELVLKNVVFRGFFEGFNGGKTGDSLKHFSSFVLHLNLDVP